MKILILCTGNSCRSQMAHGFLQSFDPTSQVFSAGTEPAEYLGEAWDYVITVCGGANENCPLFTGKVGTRVHIGFDDPSHATGTPEFIVGEFRRVRDEIKARFHDFYSTHLQ